MADPTVLIIFPRIKRSGPIAAASASTLMIASRWESLMELSLSTKPCTAATTFRMIGMSRSPKEMASSSSWDFRMVSWPDRLSCMISAMDSAEPSQLSIAPVSLSKSSSDALIMESQPAMEFFPKIAEAAAACSDSDRPPIFSRREIIVSRRLMEPSSFSTRAMLYLSM